MAPAREPHPKAARGGTRKAPVGRPWGRERDRMDEQIELPAEDLPRLGDDTRDVVVRADVAFGHMRRVDRGRELADAGFDPVALVGEGEPGAAVGQALRDRPRDRPLVGDAEDETSLAGEISHGGRVYGFSATLRALRRAVLLPLAAALIL